MDLSRLEKVVLILPFVLLPACGPPAPDLEGIKQEVRGQFPQVSHIPVETLARWREDPARKVLLIDAREPAEFNVSHLEGALNLQHPEAIRRELGREDYSEIVVYCSVGYRSADLAQRLQRMGLQKVFNLEGSIFEWVNQGRPVVNDSGPVYLVHPYDADWGEFLRPEFRAPIH